MGNFTAVFVIYYYLTFLLFCVNIGSSSPQIATHLLQFMFLSDCGFRFSLAHFPTAQCPPAILYRLFWNGVYQMKRYGFQCISFLIIPRGYNLLFSLTSLGIQLTTKLFPFSVFIIVYATVGMGTGR